MPNSRETKNHVFRINAATTATLVIAIAAATWHISNLFRDVQNRTKERWTLSHMELFAAKLQLQFPEVVIPNPKEIANAD